MDKAAIRLRRQRRQELSLKLIRFIFKGINGFAISTEYRSQYIENIKSLTYGEVDPKSFSQILLWVENYDRLHHNLVNDAHANRHFVDLGCGIGRACLIAAMSVGDMFTHVQGIDIVPGLIDQAIIARDRLTSLLHTTNAHHETRHLSTAVSKKQAQPAKSSAKSISTVGDNKFWSAVNSIIYDMIGKTMRVDDFANSICKIIGHKLFKAAIKQKGGFSNFLKSYPDHFKLISNVVEFLSHPINADIISDVDDNHDHVVLESHEDGDEVDDESTSNLCNHPDISMMLPIPHIEYTVGDIFAIDWYVECCIAYVASLLFSDEMMEKLTEQVMLMEDGSWLISLRPLILSSEPRQQRIKLVQQSFFDMSWEMAEVYFYRIQSG